MGKLTIKHIEAIKEPCRLCDGGGLWLYVKPSLKKSWVIRYRQAGIRREAGLGSFPVVTLAKARIKAIDFKRALDDGRDPVLEKKLTLAMPTFENVAKAMHEEKKLGYKNLKHANQRINSLRDYAFPKIGKLRIDQITHSMVLECISPIWIEKHETAKRTKQRIAEVISWAVAKGYRETELPMGAINKGLPKFSPKPKHFSSLPYIEIPNFYKRLQAENSISILALKLAVLTGSRTIEIRKAQWSQFDFENNIWIRPDDIMKNSKLHIVPLSNLALEVLNSAKQMVLDEKSDIVFQGKSKIKENNVQDRKEVIIAGVLSDGTLRDNAKKYCEGFEVTTHGFRSSFRNWAREVAKVPDDVAELALSHTDRNKVQASYKTTELIEERKHLLGDWANYCGG